MPKNRIHKLADGRRSYTVTDATGKRKTIAQRKAEKNKAFDKRCNELDVLVSLASTDSDMTFDALYKQWLTTYVEVYTSAADKRITEYAYKAHIKSYIGHLKLHEIQRPDIYTLLTDMIDEGYSRSTVSKARSVVSRPFNWAINTLRLPLENPVAGLRLKYGKKQVIKPVRVISESEWHRFVAVAVDSKWLYYFHLLRLTGLRPSECAGLRLTDDLGSELAIICGITKDGPSDLKTEAAKRRIPITPQIRHVIQEQKKRLPFGSKWLFPSSGGRPNLVAITTAFKRIIAKTGTRTEQVITPPLHFTLYDFRHTWATEMVRRDMPLKTLQYLMGHSDVTVTMRYYVGVTEDTKEEAARIMAM